MKPLALVLGALLVLIQYPLWLGKGGWMRVSDLNRQVGLQKAANEKLVIRNQALEADVQDLKQGLEAIEERARYEMGMVKQDEIFFQVLKDPPATPVRVPEPSKNRE